MRRISNRSARSERASRFRWNWAWVGVCAVAWVVQAGADEWGEAQESWRTGDYVGVLERADRMLGADERVEEAHLLRVEALWTLGRYEEARGALTNALASVGRSVRLRWLGCEVMRSVGEVELGAGLVSEILEMVERRPWGYRDVADRVAVGRAALLRGADPRQVLERLYEPAKLVDPGHRDPYLAMGELALSKRDYALASKVFLEGLERLPEDPDLHFGLARAHGSGAVALMRASLEAALTRNSNHVGGLLLTADYLVDAEDYAGAEEMLERVWRVNPDHPEAWAYAAVVAHLRGDGERELEAMGRALRHWAANPRVPHLVGLKLSRNYRFAEGAVLQRQALSFESGYLPAKGQLALDLLRLGEDAEGWRLAEEVHGRDGYDIAALNLVTLRDVMANFATLTNEHFRVRMPAREAAVYGARVLGLLERAREALTARYGLALVQPVLVEIFGEQKDFAVRTFGMPENHGFLGVSFGQVVTANSPASRPGQSFNWESVLWHEFCHVVTLQLTRNRMPRWLSEGLSVYEERQADGAWGQRWTPRYREMVLSGEMVPIGQLTKAFLMPRSALHVQLAYFQSSLVVEFVVERYGMGVLRAVLSDLAAGVDVNTALERRVASLSELEAEFEVYARGQALAFGAGWDWRRLDARAASADPGSTETAAEGARNVWQVLRDARRLVERGEWAVARPALEELVAGCPEFSGGDGPYPLLAAVYRGLGDEELERALLECWAGREDAVVEAYVRLMELGREANDWALVREQAGRYLAVNPLVPLPFRYLSEAAERLGELGEAVDAWRALLALEPANPAEVHYQLARLLDARGDSGARRHVLQALEEAPRHRPALRLLLAMRTREEAGSRHDGHGHGGGPAVGAVVEGPVAIKEERIKP
jgi:tetratricopeptide (TPR) repeat protein